MSDQEVRIHCLDYAIRAQSADPLVTAKAFYDWIAKDSNLAMSSDQRYLYMAKRMAALEEIVGVSHP